MARPPAPIRLSPALCSAIEALLDDVMDEAAAAPPPPPARPAPSGPRLVRPGERARAVPPPEAEAASSPAKRDDPLEASARALRGLKRAADALGLELRGPVEVSIRTETTVRIDVAPRAPVAATTAALPEATGPQDIRTYVKLRSGALLADPETGVPRVFADVVLAKQALDRCGDAGAVRRLRDHVELCYHRGSPAAVRDGHAARAEGGSTRRVALLPTRAAPPVPARRGAAALDAAARAAAASELAEDFDEEEETVSLEALEDGLDSDDSEC